MSVEANTQQINEQLQNAQEKPQDIQKPIEAVKIANGEVNQSSTTLTQKLPSNDVTQTIKDCLKDQPTYNKNKGPIILQIKAGDKKHVAALINVVEEAIFNADPDPLPKFIALYFLKEAMDTKNPELVSVVEERLMTRFGNLALGEQPKIFTAESDTRLVQTFYQLLLECIYFWCEYFSTGEGDKANSFRRTFDNVKVSIPPPKKALFFVKPNEAAKSSANVTSNEQTVNNPTSEEYLQQIRAGTVDEAAYKKAKKSLIQPVLTGNKENLKILIDTVKEILNDKEVKGINKFIAVYLLKEAMDSRNLELMNYVEAHFVSYLGSLAEEGFKVFPPEIGTELERKNFHQIILECLHFWSEYHGADSKGNKNNYRTAMDRVKLKVEPYKKVLFFAKPATVQNVQNVQKSPEKIEKMKATIATQTEGPQKDDGRLSIQRITEVLETTINKKKLLLRNLASSHQPAIDALETLRDEFQTNLQLLERSKAFLANAKYTETEDLQVKVREECEVIAKYLEDYEDLRIAVGQYRAAAIRTLTKAKAPPANDDFVFLPDGKICIKKDLPAANNSNSFFKTQANKLNQLDRRDFLIILSLMIPFILMFAQWLRAKSS